ncbi:MAG: TetR/AcrR family transcriptional regulator [Putridiphycobacter sp.]|nr:TetR/AcrR family transcriptional regulator [Putridiphycobacter sp.]
MPRTATQNKEIRTDRRAKILDAALNVFAEEGYHSASISKVSKYAGVSKGLMYNYFESKEELLHELLHEVMFKEIKIMELLSKDDFSDQSLVNLIHQTFDILAEDPKHWKLYFVMSLQPEVRAVMMNDYAEIINEFSAKFIAYFQDKYGEKYETEWHFFNTMMGGMKLSFIMDPDNYPIDRMKKKLINQFITT